MLVVLSVAAYLTFVLVTILFFDFDVNFDVRMMSPIYVLVAITAAVAGEKLFTVAWKKQTYALALALTVSFLVLAAYSLLTMPVPRTAIPPSSGARAGPTRSVGHSPLRTRRCAHLLDVAGCKHVLF